jgi:mRNA-degrading endonuclease toxin of MazEF toxin-antitoxin module
MRQCERPTLDRLPDHAQHRSMANEADSSTGLQTRGAILVDQIRGMHRQERGFRFIEHAPDEVLADIRAILGPILGIVA